ncbi:MAG: hypothetical protein QXP66_04190 [Candidatus Aenigmatarchaeota archaeon]
MKFFFDKVEQDCFFDFTPLKDREQFLKVFKEVEAKLKDELLNYQLKESIKDPRQHFVEIDGEKVSYFELQCELVREMVYFELKHELKHFCNSFIATPFFFVDGDTDFSKMEKMPVLTDADILKKYETWSLREKRAIVKILEFATPEVSICDYKAFCNYVKKEIGLYDFEQIPRIKAVLDKRRELVKEWSMKFREFASKYFDLSNVVEVEDYELQLLLTFFMGDLEDFKVSRKHVKLDTLVSVFKLLGFIDLSNDFHTEFFSSLNFKDAYYEFVQEHGTPIANLRKALKKDPNGPLAFANEADERIYKTLVDAFVFHTLGYNADSHLFRKFLIKFPAKLIAYYLLERVISPNLDFFIGQNTTYFGKKVREFSFDLLLRFLDLRCVNLYSTNVLEKLLGKQVAFYLNEILDNTRLKKLCFPIYYSDINDQLVIKNPGDYFGFNYYVRFSLISGKGNGSFREFYHFSVNDPKLGVFKERGTWYYKYVKDNSICWENYYKYPEFTGRIALNWYVEGFPALLKLEHYYLIHNFRFSDLNVDFFIYYLKQIRVGLLGYLSSIRSYLVKQEQTAIVMFVPVRGLVLSELRPSYLLDLQLRENVFEMSFVDGDGIDCNIKKVYVSDCVSTAAITVELDLNTLHDFAVYPDFYVESYEVYRYE